VTLHVLFLTQYGVLEGVRPSIRAYT